MRLLIVEDDLDFQKFLKFRLEEKCFAVDTAEDGDTAFTRARENAYDLILLDYSLPLRNGYEICTELRRMGKTMPIIMISSSNGIFHRVDGFNLGIDDYLIKPFYFEELYARINAVLRRPQAMHDPILTFDDLVLDIRKQEVRRGTLSIYLTRKEFALLEYLLRNQGLVVTRGEIMEHVWDMELDPFSNAIETHMMNLRRKIETPRRKKIIHSVPGRGYKIDYGR
jgi:DNA-binding response OmpR family regulator